eukprot:7389081-Ditylum_brightwellii.AAC.1
MSHTTDNEFIKIKGMMVHAIRKFGMVERKLVAMVKQNAHKHPFTVSRDESKSSVHDDVDETDGAIEDDDL